MWRLEGRGYTETFLSTLCPEFLGRRAELAAWEILYGNMFKYLIQYRVSHLLVDLGWVDYDLIWVFHQLALLTSRF